MVANFLPTSLVAMCTSANVVFDQGHIDMDEKLGNADGTVEVPFNTLNHRLRLAVDPIQVGTPEGHAPFLRALHAAGVHYRACSSGADCELMQSCGHRPHRESYTDRHAV